MLLFSLAENPRRQLVDWYEDVQTQARSLCAPYELSGALSLVAVPSVWENFPGNINKCAVGLAQRTMVPKLSKSIDMRFHWIQDRIKQLQFLVQHVAGANNVADFFTKSLPRAKHDQFAPYCAYDPVPAVA